MLVYGARTCRLTQGTILGAVVVLPTASAADSGAVPVLTVTVLASVTFRKTDYLSSATPCETSILNCLVWRLHGGSLRINY